MTRALRNNRLGEAARRLSPLVSSTQRRTVVVAPASDSAGTALQPLLLDPVAGRSGSTLVMKLLGTSDAIVFDRVEPFENRYIAYLCHLVGRIDAEPSAGWGMDALLNGPADRLETFPFRPGSLDKAEFSARLLHHGWTALAESFSSVSGTAKRFYAEKTYGDHAERMRRAGTEPRMINLVRDPRDIVSSVRAFDAKRGYHGFGRAEGQSDRAYLTAFLEAIRTNLDRMQRRAAEFDHVWLRYEDVVTDLDGTARRLSDWLAVELDPAAGAPAGRAYRRHATTTTPEESIGRWRNDLSDDDLEEVERVLGDRLRTHGYDAGTG